MSAICPIPSLPNELFLNLFSYFSPQELAGRISRVSCHWHALATEPVLWSGFNLEQVFPNLLKVFDESAWKTHADLDALGISCDDIEPMDKITLIPQLFKFFARLKEKGILIEGNAGVTLLTVPRNLCMQILKKFAAEPKKGHRTLLKWNDQLLFDTPVERTYRVLVTNSTLEGTRKQLIEEQEALLKKAEGKMLDPLTACTLMVADFVSSPSTTPEQLYINFTRCLRKINEEPLVARGATYKCDPRGFTVDFSYFPRDVNVGAGAMWELDSRSH